jgi:hypothetical protein
MAQNDKVCLSMVSNSYTKPFKTEKQVTVKDIATNQPDRVFTYDYAMWSFDGFTTDANGYNVPNPGSNYCDQNKAWEMLGTRMLDKAWQGLNVTMFAYGQTGSGKSYTMFGYGANKGVVPMAADRIFERIRANTDPSISFKVSVHMVEIYMEKI